MIPDLTSYLIAFLLPHVIVFGIQAILNRGFRKMSAQSLAMAAMVLGYPIYFFLCSFLPFDGERGTCFYVYFFLLYSFSAYTYFHVFNMSETSRRIRMLGAIVSEDIRDPSQLNEIYDEDKMIQARLDRLVALRQIEMRDGKYYSKGLLFPLTSMALYFIGRLLSRPWRPMRLYRENFVKSPDHS